MGSGSSTQQIGALMALSNLGQIDFALALLNAQWKSAAIPVDSAVWLLDRGLQSEEPDTQLRASDILRQYAEELALPDGRFAWPRGAREEGVKQLETGAKGRCLEAILRCLVSRKHSEWNEEYVNEAVVILMAFMVDGEMGCGAGIAIQKLLPLTGLREEHWPGLESTLKEVVGDGTDSSASGGNMPWVLAGR